MTAKEYLDRARTLDREIKSKQRELKKIKLDSQYLTSPSLGDKVISSHTNNSNSAVDKAVDLENTIKDEISDLLDLKIEIRDRISQMRKAEYRIVLTDYYITMQEWREVAKSNSYSERQVYRIHDDALEEFRKKFGFE